MVSSLKTPGTFAHDPRLFSGGRHRFYFFRGPIGSNNTANFNSCIKKPSTWNHSDSNQNQAWNLSLVGDWNTFNQTGSSPLTQTRTHGPAHEFTSFTGTNSGTLTYDAKGNQTVRPASLVAPALNLSWDFDNRLIGADTDGTPASLEVTYEFDALGRRVARNGPSGNVVFVQSGQQTIADYARGAAASSPSFRYVYGSYIDEPILRHGGTGSTLPTSGTSLAYYHRNQQYSIVALTNHSGAILERYAYTAHGELTIMAANGTLRTTSLYNNRYTYTGREWDPDFNLYHFRARLYDPIAGRFITRDPLGYVDGMSLYRGYFGLNGTDPGGLTWKHSVKSGPDLDGYFGYEIKINQNFNLGGGAVAGLQTWQTNDVNIIAVVTNGEQCSLKKFNFRILDVNDVRAGSNNIRLTDTVSLKLGKIEGGNVCFALEVTEKNLGFRSNDGKSFTERKLPVGNGYQATDDQWARAQKISGPTLSATVSYIYYDSTCCACSDDQKAQIKKLIYGVSGEEITHCCGFAMEYLKYGDLGTWLKCYS
ncbi:MAG: RHS repeat-associated core domain-containing protein [Pirellulaceae bacterium]|nr:RHS repeat-associated core domain-containing protein [Pirellulaceae bacterium]